ncbi:HAMP domain-containing sensor histidine kinase [Isosphaeraceae bacterium EP7]
MLTDLGHLSSAVGHHVINAFAAIVANAEILRLKADNISTLDLVGVSEMMVQTALEASGVARRLIDYTRPITTPRGESVSLDRLVAEVYDQERAKGRADTEWAIDFAPIPPIVGSPEQLRQMVRLFLANSYEAALEKPLKIKAKGMVDGRGWIVIEFTDDATGMRHEESGRAVEPFFTSKPAHIGVGLSIANGIWRRHRGTLSVRSIPDEGTCIRLSIEPPRLRTA